MDGSNKEGLLFVGVGFYEYDVAIKDELKKKYNVFYVNSNDFKKRFGVLYRLFSFFHFGRLNDLLSSKLLHNRIRNIPQNAVSRVLIIKGEYLTSEILRTIKERNNRITSFNLYLWDAWDNHKNKDVLEKGFEKIFSFDTKDCRERGFILRPLFYLTNNDGENSVPKKYDISFVGNNHSQRFYWLKKIKTYCLENDLNYYFFLSTTRLTLFLGLLNGEILTDDKDIIKTKTLPYKEYLNILANSKTIVDFPVQNQSGLTIRTIEALAMGIRVMTTNSSINDYHDIPSDLYMCIDENIQMEDIIDFIGRPQTKVKLPESYSISSFVKDLTD
jgi:hypothetical protein